MPPMSPVLSSAPARGDAWRLLSDVASEGTLDDLMRVAAHTFHCLGAALCVFDGGNHRMVARWGLDASIAVVDEGLCSQALHEHDVLVVPDVELEPRFSGMSVRVGEVPMRFFAGAPVRVGLESVCILELIDSQPRTMGAEERSLLLELAQTAAHWLDKRIEQRPVQAGEREFRALAEQVPGIVYRVALDDRAHVLFVSARVKELGYSPEQWMRAPELWQHSLHPLDRERVLAERAKGLATERPFDLQYRLRTAAGAWRHIRDSVRVVRPADGDRPVAQGVMTDVTDQVEAESYRDLLFSHLPDGVLILDVQERIVHANAQAEQLFGRSRALLLHQPFGKYFVADEALPLHPPGSGNPTAHWVASWNYGHPDGRTRCFEATSQRLEDGRQIRVLRDVTQRREDMDWLRKLSLAAEQASESIVITDLAANIEYVNRAAIDSSGYARDELIGRNSRILQSGLTPAARYRKLWMTLKAGKAWRGFLSNRRKDGTHYFEFAVISPVRGPDGGVTHYLAVKEDVTEKRRMGEDLERYRHHLEELVAQRTDALDQARLAAEAANKAKSAFLAAMSHEIRTPMNGVIGIADVLLQSGVTPHQKDLTETIRESAFALLSIIDDVLDFSKIEAGHLVLEQAPVVLQDLAEKVGDAMQAVAASRDVLLQVFVDPALPRQVLGDAARVRQILVNLTGNAIKFSAGLHRPGQVTMRMLALPSGGLRLAVTDNGIGMSKEVQSRIFKAFVQGETSTTRQYGGTGLGLVICRRLVKAMGGEMQVQSQADVGTTFTVDLPLQALPSLHAGPAHDLSGVHCHLLLRNPVLRDDWSSYLRAAGAQVSLLDTQDAASVAGGLSAATDVLFVDDDDPEGDVFQHGDTGCTTVLARRAPRSMLRVVSPRQLELDWVGLHRDELLMTAAVAVGRSAPPSVSPVATTAPPAADPALAAAQGELILVAEDNDINQKVIRHQLDMLGLAAEYVADGAEALARWRAAPQRYGLLLTDLQMPMLDGMALAAAVRAEEPPERRLPIIAFTANAMGEEAARCLAGGMDGYLSKPVQMDDLKACIQMWLRRPTLVRTEAENLAVGEGGTVPQATGMPGFDDAVLIRLVGPDEAVLEDLRRRFMGSLDDAELEIRQAMDREDWIAAGQTAHRLRSSSHAVGALELARVFERVETAGRERMGDAVRRELPSLTEAVNAVRQHFNRLSARTVREGPQVMCVDDDDAERVRLRERLQELGIDAVEVFADGDGLLKRLAAIDTRQVLVLVDLHMPNMDGVELIGRMRESGFLGSIVLMGGADARPLDTADRLARARQIKVLGSLHKPFSVAHLQRVLQRWPHYRAGEPLIPGADADAHQP